MFVALDGTVGSVDLLVCWVFGGKGSSFSKNSIRETS